uniref:Uncharacterized protein n=1 Tax=Physcomitrium patens TaxID=3218 RepID=A0A2K1KL44_PHYPA|nr:hypothetical protein PHYPA_008177 [Physcomitrium patens]
MYLCESLGHFVQLFGSDFYCSLLRWVAAAYSIVSNYLWDGQIFIFGAFELCPTQGQLLTQQHCCFVFDTYPSTMRHKLGGTLDAETLVRNVNFYISKPMSNCCYHGNSRDKNYVWDSGQFHHLIFLN